jgi:transcriptional regulator with XRE-family HTH domain
MVDLYTTQGFALRQVAEATGVSRSTVSKYLALRGVPPNPPSNNIRFRPVEEVKPKICKACGKEFRMREDERLPGFKARMTCDRFCAAKARHVKA